MRIKAAGFYYVLDLHETNIEDVIFAVSEAMEHGTVVRVEVLDENDRRLSLFLNGKTLDVAAIDPGIGARPTEVGP